MSLSISGVCVCVFVLCGGEEEIVVQKQRTVMKKVSLPLDSVAAEHGGAEVTELTGLVHTASIQCFILTFSFYSLTLQGHTLGWGTVHTYKHFQIQEID